MLAAYAVPLTSRQASIQWDAVDVHYSAQKYYAQRVFSGELPQWTPYIFSGFPFLADPQTGAWYPGNWPFLILGAGPKALEGELALHALLAAAGAYLLLRRWVRGSAAATGALCFALSGFFAGHSSHIGIFESATLFPWLLYALFLAVEGRFWSGSLLGTAVGGGLLLAGHFQTALYAFSGMALVAVAQMTRRRNAARPALGFLAITAVGAVLLSAVQTLPGFELTARSIRAGANYSSSTEGSLNAGALTTLILPDELGAVSGPYRGPGDVTQYYFYAGILLVPLALLGLRNASIRVHGLSLIIPALLYMAGPSLGVFRLIAWLPGFRSIRAPVHAWFLAAMALALLAAAGAEWLSARWRWAGAVLFVVFAFDLCNTNLWSNPLAYAHTSFESLYGAGLDQARKVQALVTPLTRFDAPDKVIALGPLNHPLDLRLEATYGYNPLMLSSYAEFRDAAARNPKLRDSLSVSRILDMSTGDLKENRSLLPRAYFPKELASVPGKAAARLALEILDPPRQAVLTGPLPALTQDPRATATVQAKGEQTYEVSYKSATPGVIRLGIPYFPGWRATVDDVACRLLQADYAMTAVVVPAGEKQLKLSFHSTYLGLGAGLSGLGIAALAGLATMAWKQRELS